jgi:hypothetical protein
MVGDDRILALLERYRRDLDAAARALIKAANKGGGEDNITVVCFGVSDEPAERAGEETGEHPSVDVEEDDADTLSELEAVPALERDGDTVIASVEEWRLAERDGQPELERRAGVLRRKQVVAAAVAVMLVVGIAGASIWGLAESHFVGADANGHVAVYQGVPWDLVGGVRLYRAVYVSPLRAAQLTRNERRTLFDHNLQGYGAALAAVKHYESEVSP